MSREVAFPKNLPKGLAAARTLLTSIQGKTLDHVQSAGLSVQLAEALHGHARSHRSRKDRARDRALSRLMSDRDGQAFSTLWTDRMHRSRAPGRTLLSLDRLVKSMGVPSYLGPVDRTMLASGLLARRVWPGAVMAGARTALQAQTAGLLLPAERKALDRYLQKRQAQGVQSNLNHLGEAVLGEAEAEARTDGYIELLARPSVQSISIKISSIGSQIEPFAFESTLDRIRPRLRRIYRAAIGAAADKRDKLVNLDMESFQDLYLSYALYKSVLDEPEFIGLKAGLVLQAYLPDSWHIQQDMLRWAEQRVAAGGSPLRLRIVKGANLAHESVISSQRHWPLPIFGSKVDVDANYKKMVDWALRDGHANWVHLGLASHNVFDIAYGLVTANAHNVQLGKRSQNSSPESLRTPKSKDCKLQFELLEGMAAPLRRALQGLGAEVLVYGPVVAKDEMPSAIAYLVRRLDENTAPDNFLPHSFSMSVGDTAWQAQQARFEEACLRRAQVSSEQRRTQNRQLAPQPLALQSAFASEPDTDFGLEPNRTWLAELLDHWSHLDITPIGSEGDPASDTATLVDGFDPSTPNAVPYRFELATETQVERTIQVASEALNPWSKQDLGARAALLSAVAQGLRRARAELIGALVLDAAKRANEGDVEISEAIDFCEYYLRSAQDWQHTPGLAVRPRGVVLVTSPWNFPLAIPVGGIAAALIAGNTVILKPALETVLVAERLVQIFWNAGVPRDVLQLCLCSDAQGSQLVTDGRVDTVILTGAADTARLFLNMRQDLHLLAETGGKNALIVSAMADRDQAVADAVASAFTHAGQKCSATSLLICEAEIYDDPQFMEQLRDAASSLAVGSAWQPKNLVTPLVRAPAGDLKRALVELEEGQTWLLEPEQSVDNPLLVSPGIKLGVQPGHHAHRAELFGPVLSVLRAKNLTEAIALSNDTPYGLTAGLHSLDETEQAQWRKTVKAGNLYIGRTTTGAIVQRQPFGGWKASCFGPGAKAGGPNYVAQLMHLRTDGPASLTSSTPTSSTPSAASTSSAPTQDAADFVAHCKPHLSADEHQQLTAAAHGYTLCQRRYFQAQPGLDQVLGESNHWTCLPLESVIIRANASSSTLDILLACAAALTVGSRCTVSADGPWMRANSFLGELDELTTVAEPVGQLTAGLAFDTGLRVCGPAGGVLRQAANASGIHCSEGPVSPHGRIELLNYVREQSVTVSYHRYGNLAGLQLQPSPPGDSNIVGKQKNQEVQRGSVRPSHRAVPT